MHRALASLLPLALLALPLASAHCGGRPPPSPAPSPPSAAAPATPDAASAPTAAVALVVDQLGAWVLAMHAPRWLALQPTDPACGGLCRLLHEGTYHERMEYTHAITDTAPGHATLFTGVPPSEHGIAQNERLFLDANGAMQRTGVLHDTQTQLVGEQGALGVQGVSLQGLRRPTVADQLREAQPDACILSLSLKDRGALPGGGRRPDLTLFYEPAFEAFVSSSALRPRVPEGLGRLTHHGGLGELVWRAQDPAWLQTHAPSPDDQLGEGDFGGHGRSFPHPLRGATQPAAGAAHSTHHPSSALRFSPFGDQELLAATQRALPLCDGKRTTLLSVSFSSHDYVLHAFGPHSWEAWDQLQRLDQTVGELLRTLDARYGARGWSLVLSADHGATPLPELPESARPWCAAGAENPWDLPCAAQQAVRMKGGPLYHALEAAAAAALGPGPWIEVLTDPRIVLHERARALPPARRRALVRALQRAAQAFPGVEALWELSSLPRACGAELLGPVPQDLIPRTVCFSQPPPRTPSAGETPVEGELYLVLRRGSFFDTGYVDDAGESHGSPYLFDRSVPLLVRRGDGQGAGQRRAEPISYRRFAETLREWLALPAP